MKKKLESVVQAEIIKYLKSQGIYYAKTMRSSMNGVPDILCCVQGIFLGIEVKAEGKKGNASELQKKNLREIEKSDGYALCTDNLDDVKMMLGVIRKDNDLF